MSVHPDLVEILACPESRQAVRLAGAELLDRLNRLIEEGRIRNRGGARVEKRLEEALVREDGQVLYPVVEDIPVMLVDEGILLDALKPED